MTETTSYCARELHGGGEVPAVFLLGVLVRQPGEGEGVYGSPTGAVRAVDHLGYACCAGHVPEALADVMTRASRVLASPFRVTIRPA